MNKKDFYILDEYPLFSVEKNGQTIGDYFWCICHEDNEVRVFDKVQCKLYENESGKMYLEDLEKKYPNRYVFSFVPYTYTKPQTYADYMAIRNTRAKYTITESED